LEIVDRLPVLVREVSFDGTVAMLRSANLVLDALIGYSLRGAPREPIASLIRAANASGAPLLALDIPSGLNADSGEAYDPTIRAMATLTLALPKAGLTRPAASEWVGKLYVADISVPEPVYRRLGLNVGPIFSRSDIVPVGDAAATSDCDVDH
jgi:NAD(P)H-hydrate epimerase